MARVGLLVAAWVGLTGILIAVGFGAVHSSAIAGFDRQVTSTVVAHRTPALNEAMKATTWLGSWVALLAIVVVVLALAARHKLTWLFAFFAATVWVGEAGAVTLAKHIVRRPRPPKDIWLNQAHGWSWPSGHSATAVFAFTVLAIVLTQFSRHPMTKTAIWIAGVLAIAAVAFSRIELGVHWTTDVLASLVFVYSWLAVTVALFPMNSGHPRWHHESPETADLSSDDEIP